MTTINAAQLKLAATFAAESDIRFYLEGVHVTPEGLEASNGHKAIMIAGETGIERNAILSSDGVDQILMIAKSHDKHLAAVDLSFTVKVDERTGKVMITTQFSVAGNLLGEHTSQGIEGRFPDMKRVFSNPTSNVIDGPLPQCNWAMLGKVMMDFANYKGAKKADKTDSLLFPLEYGNGQWRYNDASEEISIIVMGRRI